MRMLHIVAGLAGLASGAVALCAVKGAKLHRKSGMIFVYAMLFMSLSGAAMAAFRSGEEASVIGGLLAAYLVITALTTVRRPAAGSRGLDLGAALMGLTVALTSFTLRFKSPVGGEDMRNGAPTPMLLIFGAIALLASVSDVRMMRAGGLRGASRLARHLWRMCFALFIAAGSFFLGQADKFPRPLRIPALLALPVLAVLASMFYWLWRVRARRSPGGLVGVGAP